jgi:hypothetical protein
MHLLIKCVVLREIGCVDFKSGMASIAIPNERLCVRPSTHAWHAYYMIVHVQKEGKCLLRSLTEISAPGPVSKYIVEVDCADVKSLFLFLMSIDGFKLIDPDSAATLEESRSNPCERCARVHTSMIPCDVIVMYEIGYRCKCVALL